MKTVALLLLSFAIYAADNMAAATIAEWQKEDHARNDQRIELAYKWLDALDRKPIPKKTGPNLTAQDKANNEKIDAMNQLLITIDVERKDRAKTNKAKGSWATLMDQVGNVERLRFELTGVHGANPPAASSGN